MLAATVPTRRTDDDQGAAITGRAVARLAKHVDSALGHAELSLPQYRVLVLLSKGSALDLHPRVFAPGACGTAGFARFRTILWHLPDGSRFDLFVGRSHAVALWEWLMEAAAEYRNPPGST